MMVDRGERQIKRQVGQEAAKVRLFRLELKAKQASDELRLEQGAFLRGEYDTVWFGVLASPDAADGGAGDGDGGGDGDGDNWLNGVSESGWVRRELNHKYAGGRR